jgi:hypothetical protein
MECKVRKIEKIHAKIVNAKEEMEADFKRNYILERPRWSGFYNMQSALSLLIKTVYGFARDEAENRAERELRDAGYDKP